VLLLDTNVLIWLSEGSPRLGDASRALVEAAIANEEACFASISMWEVALLSAKGRLSLGISTEIWRGEMIESGFKEVAMDGPIGVEAANLTDLHRDPADRIIVATTINLRAQLVTADQKLIDWFGKPGRLAAIDARV
jgi:PIN domain nuclease of toxin-antitoxin system